MDQNISRLRRQNEFSKRYQAANKAKGLCPCGRSIPRPNKSRCEQCAIDRHDQYIRTKTEGKCKALLRSYQDYRKIKEQLFQEYGKECRCCGEVFEGFLVLDHIYGGGTKERLQISKSKGRGVNFYKWLLSNSIPGHPNPNYQILCANCNMAKGTKEFCPCPYKT